MRISLVVTAAVLSAMMVGGCMAAYAVSPQQEKAYDGIFRDDGRVRPASVGDATIMFGGGESDDKAVLPAEAAADRATLILLTAVEERKIVYNGRFSVVVADPAAAIGSFGTSVERLGGYMARQTLEEITVRVPAAEFDKAVGFLSDLGTVTAKEVSAEDVTEQYADLELRLANARAALKRYTELLEQAETPADVLAVEKELQRVRLELEQIEGRLKALANRVAYGTITVRFVKTAEAVQTQVRLPFYWLRRMGLDALMP